jgi:hypothetical protein
VRHVLRARRPRLLALLTMAALLGSLQAAASSQAAGASFYAETNKGRWCYVYAELGRSNTSSTNVDLYAQGGTFCNFVIRSTNGTTSLQKLNDLRTLGTAYFGCANCNQSEGTVFRNDYRQRAYKVTAHADVYLYSGEVWLYGFPTAQAQGSACIGFGTAKLTCDVSAVAYAN